MITFQKHIFICVNERPDDDPRGSCKGDALVAAFKTAMKKHGVSNRDVRANRAGCLDHCAAGPTVVVYPEAVWYGHVKVEDVDEIVRDHIVGGTPVDRLRLK